MFWELQVPRQPCIPLTLPTLSPDAVSSQRLMSCSFAADRAFGPAVAPCQMLDGDFYNFSAYDKDMFLELMAHI